MGTSIRNGSTENHSNHKKECWNSQDGNIICAGSGTLKKDTGSKSVKINNLIYVNDSSYMYYKKLQSKLKKLWSNSLISNIRYLMVPWRKEYLNIPLSKWSLMSTFYHVIGFWRTLLTNAEFWVIPNCWVIPWKLLRFLVKFYLHFSFVS